MATITLKNVPEPLHTALKKRAERNRRSLNQEALFCLERAVERPDPDDPRHEWLAQSEQALMKVWDNAKDEVYNELLEK